jgi:DNA processing protein
MAGLKGYPIVIVSGMAIGIDSVAHNFALKYGLRTIAFPGSGLDPQSIYPPSKRFLANKILETGNCLISEFERDQVGAKWTFPARNRLMAGISHATLIIEAKKHSGTLLTAEYATEFNRDILAVPGSILEELSYGPNMLIQKGATPITSSEDILESLGLQDDKSQPRVVDIGDQWSDLDPACRRIMSHLNVPMTKGQIINNLDLPVSEINVALSRLELKNLIRERSDGLLECVVMLPRIAY